MAYQGVQPVFRYQYMVTEIGTLVLRQLFDYLVGPDLVGYLNDKQCMSVLTKQRTLTYDQRKLLPPFEVSPSSTNFDFSLLVCLLTNICNLRSRADLVAMNALPTDHSIEDCITRLRACRNKLSHGRFFLPGDELERKIQEVAVILHSLSYQLGNLNLTQLIIEAQYLPLDELQPADKGVYRYVPPIKTEGSIVDPPLIPEIPIRDLLRLSSISLCGIKMEHSNLSNLVKYLSNNVSIVSLNLSYVSCNSHGKRDRECTLHLNLKHHWQLSSLRLYYVNITCGPVSKGGLKSITLCPLSEHISSSYSDVFSSIEDSRLVEIHIYGSLAKFNESTMEAMATALKTLQYLKALRMNSLELPDRFQLHSSVTQLSMKLDFVTMTRDSFKHFTTNCIGNIKEAYVEFNSCSIKPGAGSHSGTWRKTVCDMYEHFANMHSVMVTYRDEFCLYIKHEAEIQ